MIASLAKACSEMASTSSELSKLLTELPELADSRRSTDNAKVEQLAVDILKRISSAYRNGDKYIAKLNVYDNYPTDHEMACGRAQSVIDLLQPKLPTDWHIIRDGPIITLCFPYRPTTTG